MDDFHDGRATHAKTSVTTVGGMPPQGADVLRERLRWAAAERRWCPSLSPPPPPTTPPVGRGILPSGAQLTRFTEVRAVGPC